MALTSDTTDGLSNHGIDKVSSVGTLNVTNVEQGSTLSYSINGGTTFTSSFTAAPGANAVIVRATDAAGNTSDSDAFTFTLDTATPSTPKAVLNELSNTGLENDILTNLTSVTIEVSGIESNQTLVTYRLDLDAAKEVTGSSFDLSNLTAN